MREYRLFKHRSGSFEVIPIGWSFWALTLSLFWAMEYGVFARFARYFLPAIAAMMIGMLMLDSKNLHFLGTILAIGGALYGNGFVIYFSAVAYDWRADALVSEGYEQIATMRGSSGEQALSEWARSDKADDYLENE